MRLKTLDLLLVGAIVVIPLVVGWRYFHPPMTRMEQESLSEDFGGLQVGIRSLERQVDDLEIVYVYRWAVGKERELGFRHSIQPVDIEFFDADRQRLGPDVEAMRMLEQAFRYGTQDASEQFAVVPIPSGACHVAVREGSIATKLVPIPGRDP
jgi:hypothetical protein